MPEIKRGFMLAWVENIACAEAQCGYIAPPKALLG